MIKEHKLNLELSREVYEKCKGALEVKQCYNNVFYVVTYYPEYFNKDNHWQVAYGYHSAIGNLMARHCFITNKNNEVIDPTIFTRTHSNPEESEDKIYISHTIFDFEDYLNALEEEEGYPALYRTLYEKDKETSEGWAVRNGFILLG